MTVFDTAIDTLFTNSDLAVDATYSPAAGGSSSVRVIVSHIEEPTDVFNAGAVVLKSIADIRVSDVALPVQGDGLAIGSDTYTITNPQKKDANQLIWTMELIE